MTREEIKAILSDISKEQLDSIMNLHGTDIEKVKATAETKIEDLTAQLTTAKDTLKSFDGVDVKELQGKITQLSADLTTKDADYQAKISDMEFNTQLDGTITASGARNAKAVRALLDLDNLRQSKNQAEDIKKALETVKTDNDYLFCKADDKSPFKGLNPAESGDKVTKADISKMNFDELTAFLEANPNQ